MNLLWSVLQESDRAQELYERAIAADPDYAFALGNYASFLSSAGKESGRAQELFERAIAADPDNANVLGNYARLRFERPEDANALRLIDSSFQNAEEAQDPLRAELWRYLFALGPSESRPQALSSRAVLVDAGVRSPGCDFSSVLARARAEASHFSESR